MEKVRHFWERFRRRALVFTHRHLPALVRFRHRVRVSEDALHLFLAAVVGVIGGGACLAYQAVNQGIKWLAFGQTGNFLDIAESIPTWRLVLVPTLGGLAAGLVLLIGLRLIGNPGLSNLLEVIVAGDGRLPLRQATVSAASSVVSISTGASIGREGLVIQLAAALASKLGRMMKWPPYRLRLLVACGAAAGLAAGCNAPVAGAIFAALVVLGNFSMNTFAPLVCSSVVATVVVRTPSTPHGLVRVPDLDFTSLAQLPWFVPLGIVCGLIGALFLKLLRESESLASGLGLPMYLRITLAGAAVGALALLFPEVLGNGHEAANEVLSTTMPLRFLAGLFIAKMLATVVTVGAGTVGGVFTPTLFLGASLGSVFAVGLHETGFGAGLPQGAFALVGMGALLAATTHSPLLAIIMIFELSLNYSVMPPLMIACAVATLVSRAVHRESIYAEPLRRKGLEMARESARTGAATEGRVGDFMRAPVPPLRETATLQQMADRFLTSSNNFLPVVNEAGRLLGVVALHDVKNFLNAGHELAAVIALDLLREVPLCLTPDQRLMDVLPSLLAVELRNVPVISTTVERRLIGAVARTEILGALGDAIAAGRRRDGGG